MPKLSGPQAGEDAAMANASGPPPPITPVTRATALAARLHLLPVAVLVPGLLLSRNWWHTILVLVGAVVVEIAMTVIGLGSRLRVDYAALDEAIRLRRGAAALKLLDRFETLLTTYKLRHAVGEVELLTRRAQVLLLLGKRPDALRTCEAIRELPDVPEWMYWLSKSRVHTTAHEHLDQLAALRKAEELGPPQSDVKLDLALQLALRVQDPSGARAMFEAGAALPVTAAVKELLPIVEGFVLLAEARREEAAEKFRAFCSATRRNPATEYWGDLALAGLCLASEGSERRDAFARVAPRLEERQEHDLLARCRAAIGS